MPRDKHLLVRVSADELERWRRAAEEAGLSRSEWVRRVLERESHETDGTGNSTAG